MLFFRDAVLLPSFLASIPLLVPNSLTFKISAFDLKTHHCECGSRYRPCCLPSYGRWQRDGIGQLNVVTRGLETHHLSS